LARTRVLWQVLREGGCITAVGIAIGLLLALGAGQLLQGFLYGVNAVEPVVLVSQIIEHLTTPDDQPVHRMLLHRISH
jgi:ABC-type antimicrobial peptide transport system permease subunit